MAPPKRKIRGAKKSEDSYSRIKSSIMFWYHVSNAEWLKMDEWQMINRVRDLPGLREDLGKAIALGMWGKDKGAAGSDKKGFGRNKE